MALALFANPSPTLTAPTFYSYHPPRFHLPRTFHGCLNLAQEAGPRSRCHPSRLSISACSSPPISTPIAHQGPPSSPPMDEWQKQRHQESKELERLRQLEDQEEEGRIDEYRQIGTQLKNFPEEDIRQAKRLVASLIKSGEDVEERIIEAAENDGLTELVLLAIRNRLELARYDGERDAVQALDLLFRRVEMEIIKRRSSMAAQFLNELLNLHDGFSHTEWINRCRKCMLEVFPREDAFTILAPPGIDLSSQVGPIDIPAEEDDTLLRIDFIREVDKILADIETQPRTKTVEGLDAQSVGIRLQRQQKDVALQQIKDLRNLAVTLRW